MTITYNPSSPIASEFINDHEICETLSFAQSKCNDIALANEILDKAALGKGLSHREAALLLHCTSEDIKKRTFDIARQIKQRIYGNRIVLFAPLYLSNHCINGCVYCPYHAKNKTIPRRKLSQEEIRQEVIALQDMGHKRLALETGEHPTITPIDYILQSIDTIYSTKHRNGAIRRINVNIAATSVENYRLLHQAAIGTYILFQETYHKTTYQSLHPSGPKSDWAYHTEAMDRAMEGGIDDVGIGVLFGLYDYRYDLVAMLMHAEHLEARFGVGPHTISVPRIRPADDINPLDFPNAVTDDVFQHIVAILRIAVPYTGMIVSTRESQQCRELSLDVGISQLSGASRTTVGGYSQQSSIDVTQSAQFDINDERSLDEIVNWLLRLGYIPSFCTACYREGRTGDRFMALAKSGQIGNCCAPNALMTLQEYLEDYASADTRAAADNIIEREIASIPSQKVRELAIKRINEIKSGLRDFRF